METTAAQGAFVNGHAQVCEPGAGSKVMAGFLVLLFGALAIFLTVMAVGAIGRGGETAVFGSFFAILAVGQVALLYFLWPFIDTIFRLRIAVGQGQASFRLPARRKTPVQPAFTFTIPLQQIERLATRIELIRSMGQIQQMRQFAIKANGQWIEYGGVIENSYNGMIGASGRVALVSVEALQRATGLQVDDQGVVEGAKKGEAGTPWGGAGLAIPTAEAALVSAGKNAVMWRNIVFVAVAVALAARLIEAFAR